MENTHGKELVKWDKSFETGNPVVDGQHKKLFEMINNLNFSIEQKRSGHLLAEILDKLSVYVANHFNTEEELMIKYSYPEYSVHKQAHDELKEKTSKLIKLYELKKVDLTATVSQFLSDWIKDHIKDTDMKFIEWLRTK